MKTTLTELLEIRYPIVQAPIGSAATAELAAAVSNAGGLGRLAMSWKTLEEMRVVILKTKSLTSHSFAVNFVLSAEFEHEERVNVCIEEKVPVVSFSWDDTTSFYSKLKQVGTQ